MKKLKLDLDQLQVESFETAAPRAGRGTVLGHKCSVPWDTSTCPPPPTGDCESLECLDTSIQQCGYSYGGTCGASPPQTYDGCLLGGAAPAFGGDDTPYLCV